MSDANRIGITLGDPSGIGPEIIAHTLAAASPETRQTLLVFADRPILERAFTKVTGDRLPGDVEILDRGLMGADQAVPGRPSEAGARAQVGYLEAAIAAIRGKTIAGLVTAPINKHEAKRAGFDFTGHTDFLAARLGAGRPVMMFAGPRLKVALATVHISLAEVSSHLDVDGLTHTIMLAAEALERDFGIIPARIGVAGVNPHAGEQGLFGKEERDIITPAIEECRRRLAGRGEVSGPLVPDAAFRQAVDGHYDLIVAMYHDQGLIPVKLVDFEAAVNVTLGLPVVRTSPDHGVAYDLAGTGKARPQSFMAALDLCTRLVARRNAGE